MEQEMKSPLAAFQGNTKFMYHPGIKIEYTQENRGTNKVNFHSMQINGTFKLEDAFILNAIYLLGHATIDMILQCLKLQARHFPDKPYPDKKFNQIKRRLAALAGKGLVLISDYVTSDKHVILVYTCTIYGHIFFSNTLDMTYMSYDINLVFHAEVEQFRYMASASIAMAMAREKDCTSLDLANKNLFGESAQLNLFTYARILMDYQGEKVLYLVEPLYFSVNNEVISNHEVLDHMESRMDSLFQKIGRKEAELGMKIIPVFCMENIDGMKHLGGIAKRRGISEWYHHALYTSENILFCMGHDLSKLFFKTTLSVKTNGEIDISLCSVPHWQEFR